MNKFVEGQSVVVQDEISAVTEYLVAQWKTLDTVINLVTDVYDAAFSDTKFLFRTMPLQTAMNQREVARRKFLKKSQPKQKPDFYENDAGVSLLEQLQQECLTLEITAKKLSSEIRLDTRVGQIVKAIKPYYPDVTKCKPQGWRNVVNRQDSGVDESEVLEAFRGTYTGGAGHFGLVEATAAEEVVYLNQEHQLTYFHSLVQGLYRHFYFIIRHNNGLEALEAFNKLDFHDLEKDVLSNLVVKPKNVVLKALVEMAKKGVTAKPVIDEENRPKTVAEMWNQVITGKPVDANPAEEQACRKILQSLM